MFGFDRTDVKTLPLDNVAQWQRGYDISTDAGEIVMMPITVSLETRRQLPG